MRPTLVFDLDGTLVDSLPDLRASLNRLLAARHLAPLAPDAVAAMIGDGAAALVERGMAARGQTATAADLDDFLADYGAHAAEASRPFADVHTTLEQLHTAGWRLAVCTNKPQAAAQKLLTSLDLLRFFDAVGGGDSFPTRKPDPAHLLASIALAGGDRHASLMVGDHRNDIQAAHGAGVRAIFALWGYGSPAMQAGAAATAHAINDVPRIAAGLLPISR